MRRRPVCRRRSENDRPYRADGRRGPAHHLSATCTGPVARPRRSDQIRSDQATHPMCPCSCGEGKVAARHLSSRHDDGDDSDAYSLTDPHDGRASPTGRPGAGRYSHSRRWGGSTRNLALDLAAARIRVNAVELGPVDTRRWRGMLRCRNPSEKRPSVQGARGEHAHRPLVPAHNYSSHPVALRRSLHSLNLHVQFSSLELPYRCICNSRSWWGGGKSSVVVR